MSLYWESILQSYNFYPSFPPSPQSPACFLSLAHWMHPCFPLTDMGDSELSHDAILVLMNALLKDNAITEDVGNDIVKPKIPHVESEVDQTPTSTTTSTSTTTTATTTTTAATTTTTYIPTKTKSIFDYIFNPLGEYVTLPRLYVSQRYKVSLVLLVGCYRKRVYLRYDKKKTSSMRFSGLCFNVVSYSLQIGKHCTMMMQSYQIHIII